MAVLATGAVCAIARAGSSRVIARGAFAMVVNIRMHSKVPTAPARLGCAQATLHVIGSFPRSYHASRIPSFLHSLTSSLSAGTGNRPRRSAII